MVRDELQLWPLRLKEIATRVDDSEGLAICRDFQAARISRLEVDRRIMDLPSDNACRNVLWQELELLIASERGAVQHLTAIRSGDLTGLRAKAAVLRSLLEADPVVANEDALRLALSLASDTDAVLGAVENQKAL